MSKGSAADRIEIDRKIMNDTVADLLDTQDGYIVWMDDAISGMDEEGGD